jgi:alpha-L-fucosidase 2
MQLLYNEPASLYDWNSALPLGNGRLGAMLPGATSTERVFLNEDTIWARSKQERNNPQALEYLPQVRRLIQDGRLQEAQFLAEATMMGAPGRLQPYQPLGHLWLHFSGSESDKIHNYRRSLDLENALFRCE